MEISKTELAVLSGSLVWRMNGWRMVWALSLGWNGNQRNSNHRNLQVCLKCVLVLPAAGSYVALTVQGRPPGSPQIPLADSEVDLAAFGHMSPIMTSPHSPGTSGNAERITSPVLVGVRFKALFPKNQCNSGRNSHVFFFLELFCASCTNHKLELEYLSCHPWAFNHVGKAFCKWKYPVPSKIIQRHLRRYSQVVFAIHHNLHDVSLYIVWSKPVVL